MIRNNFKLNFERNILKAYKFKYSLKKLKIFSKLNLYFFNFEIVAGEIYVKFITTSLLVAFGNDKF
jgi:hypothetical protein